MTTVSALQLMRELLRHLPQDLSVSWIAVSALYFLDFPILPEPMVALVVSTFVGVASSVVKSSGITGMLGADPSAPSAPDPGPWPPNSPFRPQPYPFLPPTVPVLTASSEKPFRQGPIQPYPYESSSRVLERRGSTDAARAGRSHPDGERHDAEIPTPSDGQVAPSGSVPFAPAAVPVVPKELDLDAYSSADEIEIQCPQCGSFAVTIDESTGAARDTTCAHEWSLPVDDSAPPDVVVRSWFSP